ncbi:MAG: hypothetical protein WA700_05490 [Acidobacteriaceae bacterium]
MKEVPNGGQSTDYGQAALNKIVLISLRKKAKTDRCQSFREVSIDSFFFRGTLVTQSQKRVRIVFFGESFPKICQAPPYLG